MLWVGVLLTALLLTGCTSELVQDLKAGAKTLRSSGAFSQVIFDYERGLDPMTRSRSLDDFSALLQEDGDLVVAGQALADVVDTAGKAPDILVDESTWILGFHTSSRGPATAEITSQDWTELLNIARSTHARELEVWQLLEHEAQEKNDFDPKLTLRASAPTPASGLEELEQLVSTHTPVGIRDVYFELQAGSVQQPWHYETQPAGSQHHGNHDAPIRILIPKGKEIGNARAVLEAAQQHFGELHKVWFYYLDDIPNLEILHDGRVETCQENIAYAQQVAELLGEDLDITLSKVNAANGVPLEIYHEVSDASAAQGQTSNGCNPDL